MSASIVVCVSTVSIELASKPVNTIDAIRPIKKKTINDHFQQTSFDLVDFSILSENVDGSKALGESQYIEYSVWSFGMLLNWLTEICWY